MNPLISVVVPIYNVAPYLRECLDSLIHQTYQNLEIILINDGSTDESESIAKEYLKDDRICLISQENGGLSKARNVGMRKASGKWIMFVDSDDYLALNYIQEMQEILVTSQADFVCNDSIISFSSNTNPNLQPSNAFQTLKVYSPNASNIVFGGAVWRFLFSLSFLRRSGVEFLEGKIYEDEAFLYMISPLASKIARFCGEPYFYRKRNDSIMAKHASYRSYDLLDVFEAIFIFYQKRGLLQDFHPPYYFLTSSGIGYMNELEYLRRAKALAQKLNLSLNIPSPCLKFLHPLYWLMSKNLFMFQLFMKIKLKIRAIWEKLKSIGKRIQYAKRKLKF